MSKEITSKELLTLPFTAYDKEEVFNKEIKPLLDQLYEKLKAEKMPFFVRVAYRQTEDGQHDGFESTGLFGPEVTPANFLCYALVEQGEYERAYSLAQIDYARRSKAQGMEVEVKFFDDGETLH